MPHRIVTGMVVLAVLTAADDRQHCREAIAGYNEMIVAVPAGVRAYEQCVKASFGRDGCGAEYIELQITHRDFERAVDERAAECRGIE